MPDNERHAIDEVLAAFLTDLESIRTSATISGFMMSAVSGIVAKKYVQFVAACEKVEGEPETYRIPIEQSARHRKLKEESQRGHRSVQILPRSFIVSLISQYDAFLSGLVKALFELQPALLSTSSRSIDISELLTFSSIEEAKDAFLDMEIESLLRDSHHQQFEWLEKKFDIRTLRTFERWPEFVELTQRRNLFVHSDGRVSKQYLNVCKVNRVFLGELKPGDQMEADGSYVRKSADVLYEVGVKLSQVLWRKIRPDQHAAADISLQDISYGLIAKRRYSLAINLLDFAFDTIKRFSNPETRLRMLINRANAYRLSGDRPRCLELLGQEQWEAYDPSFRLGAYLLKGETDNAYKCMRLIGSDGSITKNDYRDWPLFEGFREEDGFRKAFSDIFREELLDEVVGAESVPEAKGNVADFSLDDFLKDEESPAQNKLIVN